MGSTPHLTLVSEYRLPAPGPGARPAPAGRDERAARTADLRDKLSPAECEVFDLLRAWRVRLAREEGVPAYAILTAIRSNAELVAVTRVRPQSHGALHAIPGIGRKRAERYGKDLLAITGETATAAPPPEGVE